MANKLAERDRLMALLLAASKHLRDKAKSFPDYTNDLLDCALEIDKCGHRIESKENQREHFVQVLNTFGPSLDWDHLADDFGLREEILSIVEVILEEFPDK